MTETDTHVGEVNVYSEGNVIVMFESAGTYVMISNNTYYTLHAEFPLELLTER